MVTAIFSRVQGRNSVFDSRQQVLMSRGQGWRARTGTVCRLLLSKISAFKASFYGELLYCNNSLHLQSIWRIFTTKSLDSYFLLNCH